jgi:hypothetical protein
MKLYTNDRIVPYKTTGINPLSTKAEIDGLLARFGIKKSAWEWDIENNKISLTFQFQEEVEGRLVEPMIRVEPPRIWNKGSRRTRESINWAVSMRVMFWFIKSHLEMSYLLQSGKLTEFLPYIIVDHKRTLKDVIVPRLDEVQQFAALPEPAKEPPRVINPEKEQQNCMLRDSGEG